MILFVVCHRGQGIKNSGCFSYKHNVRTILGIGFPTAKHMRTTAIVLSLYIVLELSDSRNESYLFTTGGVENWILRNRILNIIASGFIDIYTLNSTL